MWTCARCGQAHPAYLMKCGVCGGDRREMAAVAVEAAAVAPPCPACRGAESRRLQTSRLRCETCGHEYEDYEEWVRQCRAAAYAARDHRAPPPPPPPAPPPGLTAVAAALALAAVLFAVAAWTRVGGVLLDVAIGLAGLQFLAALALMLRMRHALALTRVACGLSAAVPVVSLIQVGVFAYACRNDARRCFEGPPDPASPRARANGLAAVALLILAALGVHAAWVRPEIATARSWGVPMPPLLEAAARLQAVWPAAVWAGLAALLLPALVGAVSRRGFAWALAAAAVATAAVAGAAGAGAWTHRKEVRRAEAFLTRQDTSVLLAALQDPDAKVRLAAAHALRRSAPAAAVAAPVLKLSLEDPLPSVRFAAATALARIDAEAEAAAPVLASGLETDAAAALHGLYLLGPRARAALPALLSRLPTDERVVPVLEEIGSAALPGLTRALSHAEPAARRRAAAVLRRMGPAARSAGPALVERLGDPDPGVRDEAARATAEVLQDKAVALLQDRIQDPAAAAALCALGVREGLRGVTAQGSFLNAVRTPGLWDHLRRTVVDRRLEGRGLDLVHRVAEEALLCAEVGPVAEKLPALQSFHRVHADARRRSALDVLRSLDVEFVLDEGRLLVLDPVEAHHFWSAWLLKVRGE